MADEGGGDPQYIYEHRMRLWEKNLELRIALFQGVIAFATLSIKSLLIFNGGAILALLTFYGNVLAREPNTLAVGPLAAAIQTFVVGVVAALFCSMAAYFTQIVFTEVEGERQRWIWGSILRVVAIIAAIVSMVAFIVGAFESVSAFQHLGAA